MIIESGVLVALGLLAMFWRMSWRNRLRLLSHPLALDVVVFVLLNFLHYGTFSGMMVAAVGALVCSALVSLGRKCFGYIERGQYIPGIWNVSHQLTARPA